MLHKVLASLLALFTLAFCPAAFASSYGEMQLAPSYKTTYSASTSYFTGAASATDLFEIYGSSTKTIKVLKIFANYTTTTANEVNKLFIVRRSTANSAGTSTTLTNVKIDSNNAAATAVVKNYTANPTLGTTVGQIDSSAVCSNLLGDGRYGFGTHVEIYNADKYGQAIVLRGTAEGLVVNNNGVTIPGTGPQVQFTVIWTEE